MSICLGGEAASGTPPRQEPRREAGRGDRNGSEPAGPSQQDGARLNVNAPPFSSQGTSTSLYATSNQTVFLQTALTTLHNPTQPAIHQDIRAVLDLGSQRSYVTQRIASALRLESERVHRMSIFTFGSTEKILTDCQRVRVKMRTRDGEVELFLFTTPVICEPLATPPVSLCISRYDHLADLDLADPSDGSSAIEIDVLIGSDYYWMLATGNVSHGSEGPVAMETKLGWVLSGPSHACDPSYSLLTAHTLRVGCQEEVELDNTLRAFWELESLGISESGRSVHQEFEESVMFRHGRYKVSLPWKKPHPMLPDNFDLSSKRLQSLLRRLRQTPGILLEYDSVIRKQLELGIIQRVPDSDVGIVGEVHYLPHHAVVKQDKDTTKVRVVYDASAKSGGPSLNECLFASPNFNQKMLDILLRFSSYPVALTSDIEKAFLMVSVAEDDRDVLRFLWVDDITQSKPEIQIFRLDRKSVV